MITRCVNIKLIAEQILTKRGKHASDKMEKILSARVKRWTKFNFNSCFSNHWAKNIESHWFTIAGVKRPQLRTLYIRQNFK